LAHDENREILLEMLENSHSIQTVYPSSANYVLVKLEGLCAEAFQARLIPYKVMVRDCQNFDGLDERYVRIAIKSKRDLGLLAEALKSIEL
jgi:threonine-phosphate decarboxylase